MGQDAAVGCCAFYADTCQQGGLEPSPVLVRTLQVEIRGRLKFFTLAEYTGVCHAGVEPHVEGVRHLLVVLRLLPQQFGGL